VNRWRVVGAAAALVAAGLASVAISSGLAAGPDAAPRLCTRYAAPSGADGNPGMKTRPFRSAQRLADSLRPGQTGCLRAGVYADTIDGFVLKVVRGGKPGLPVTIRSYPSERATLRGRIWVHDGADHVTLSHLNIRGTEAEITFKVYSDDVVVEDNDITNLRRGKSCLILGSTTGWGVAHRTIVRRNRFHDCGRPEDANLGHGIYAQSIVNGRITGNVFWNSQAYAIQFYPNARNNRFDHNIIDGGPPSVRGGVLFGGNPDYASSDNTVEFNVIAYAQSSNLVSYWEGLVGRGNVARKNCLWRAKDGNVDAADGGFRTQDNIVAAPGFVDRQSHDYRLQRWSRCLRLLGWNPAARLQSP
jgi:hypothetical protein